MKMSLQWTTLYNQPVIKKSFSEFGLLIGSPNGSRTRVSSVRGKRPRPLDDRTKTMPGVFAERTLP